MNAKLFFTKVSSDPQLEWLGVREGDTPADDEVLVRYKLLDSKFAIAVDAIRNNSWTELQSVLMGQRTPQIMTHVSRIVGYYSALQNWNKSKIAELKDRQLGNYDIREVAPVAATQVEVAA